MVEFLKTTRYSKVLEENTPNEDTIKSMQDIEAGDVKTYKSACELMSHLKESAGVYPKDIK